MKNRIRCWNQPRAFGPPALGEWISRPGECQRTRTTVNERTCGNERFKRGRPTRMGLSVLKQKSNNHSGHWPETKEHKP